MRQRFLFYVAVLITCMAAPAPVITDAQLSRGKDSKVSKKTGKKGTRHGKPEEDAHAAAKARVTPGGRKAQSEPPPPPKKSADPQPERNPKSIQGFDPAHAPAFDLTYVVELQSLGYRVGSGNDVERAAGVRQFQLSEGLEDDGIVGPKTRAAIAAANVRFARLQQMNSQPSVEVLVLETQVDRSRDVAALYALYGRSGLLYRGNDGAILTAQILERAANTSGALYIDGSTYPADRVDALMATLKISDSSLRFVRSAPALDVLKPGVVLDSIHPTMALAGGWATTVEFLRVETRESVGTRKVVSQPLQVRFWAATLDLVAELVEWIQHLFAGELGPQHYAGSIAELVERATDELAKRHGVTKAEMRTMMRAEFRNVEIGLRLGPADLLAP